MVTMFGLHQLEISPDFYLEYHEIKGLHIYLLYPVGREVLYYLAELGFYKERHLVGSPIIITNTGRYMWRGREAACLNFDQANHLFHNTYFNYGTDKIAARAEVQLHGRWLLEHTKQFGLPFAAVPHRRFVQEYSEGFPAGYLGYPHDFDMLHRALVSASRYKYQHLVSPQASKENKPQKRGFLSRLFGGKKDDEAVAAK